MNTETGGNLPDRIKQCAKLVGSADALAEKAGIPRRTLGDYMSGVSEPDARRLLSIADAARVSLEWLVAERGPIRRGIDFVTEREAAGYGPSVEFMLVPRYRANKDGDERESETTQLAFRHSWIAQRGLDAGNLVVARVYGDAMAPTIRDGGLVLLDTSQNRLTHDGIYGCIVGDELVARRLQADLNGGAFVRSDNPAYREQQLTPEQLGGLFIIGRAVWAGGEL